MFLCYKVKVCHALFLPPTPPPGRIRLVQASQYTVQPVIQKSPSVVTGQGVPDSATYSEKQEAIAAAFGSRKAKQAVARRRQNQVCLSPLTLSFRQPPPLVLQPLCHKLLISLQVLC